MWKALADSWSEQLITIAVYNFSIEPLEEAKNESFIKLHGKEIMMWPTYMSEPIPGETRFAIKGQTRHILYTTFPGIQSSSIEGRKYGRIILRAN